MLLLKNEKLEKEFNIPQSINDINFEYLQDVVKGVSIAKHYCIVALLTTAKISDLIDTKNNHTGNTKFVVVKFREDTSNDIIEKGKIAIIAPSDVFNGIDCNNTKNELFGFNIKEFIDSDPLLRMSIVRGDAFKAVANSSAKALILNSTDTPKTLTLDTTTNKNAVIVGFKIIADSSVVGITDISIKKTGTSKYITSVLKDTITNA